MSEDERKAAIERDAMALAQLIYDIYQDEKRKEMIKNAVNDNSRGERDTWAKRELGTY